MPKDLTKLSLKAYEAMGFGDVDDRFSWKSGSIELTVSTEPPRAFFPKPDEER